MIIAAATWTVARALHPAADDEMPPKTVRKRPLFKKHKGGPQGEDQTSRSGSVTITAEDEYGRAIRRRRKRCPPSHDPSIDSPGTMRLGNFGSSTPSPVRTQNLEASLSHVAATEPRHCEGSLEPVTTSFGCLVAAAKHPKLAELSSNASTAVPPVQEPHLPSTVPEAGNTNSPPGLFRAHSLTVVQPSKERAKTALSKTAMDDHKQAIHKPVTTSPVVGLSAEHAATQAARPHPHAGCKENEFFSKNGGRTCVEVAIHEGMEMEVPQVEDSAKAVLSATVGLRPQCGMGQKSVADSSGSSTIRDELDVPSTIQQSVDSILLTNIGGRSTDTSKSASVGQSRQLPVASVVVETAEQHCSVGHKEDSLVDELFGISESAATNTEIEEAFLDGICPEDLSFTLNASVFDSSKSPGTCTSKSPPIAGISHQTVSLTPKQPFSHSAALHTTPVQASIAFTSASDLHRGSCHISKPAFQKPSHRSTPASNKNFSTQGLDSPPKDISANPHTLYVSADTPFAGELLAPESRGFPQEPRPQDSLHCYPPNTFYGLPLKVHSCLEEHRGIKQLYDWQDTCLRLPGVVRGGNLIYSLPTSGGKTLVAEVIILRQLLLGQRDALLVLPFVSIVQEKVRQLVPFASEQGFVVEEYAASRGRLPPRKRRKKKVVYIATIEKANALVNSLIELGWLGSLGLVVVDELHMVGDGGIRGATLEACLAKIQHCSADIQLVGMSATLSNQKELAQFLRAEVYSSDFRPVELHEYVKMGRCVYSVKVEGGAVNFLPERDIQNLPNASSTADADQLVPLVMEVLPHSSCLLFCPTRRNCQNVALLLINFLPGSLREIKTESRHHLLKLLNVEASGVCPILARTIPYGIAYHHSGLTSDERRVIEEAYLEGVLCLLTCTSTLAAGVNLPAKRVILRSPYVGNQFLSRSQYKQMVGRAGRVGLCDTGESVLIVRQQDREKVLNLLSAPYDSCHSSLLGGGAGALLSLLLTLIGLKLVKCTPDLHSFFRSTLLYVQHDRDQLSQSCNHALSRLVAMGYITMETSAPSNDFTFRITSLGKATYKGCLPVESAHLVYRELVAAQCCLVLSTDLHLLFLATPPDLAHTIKPNWMAFFETLTSLGPDELRVAEVVGVNPGVISRKATGTAGKMSEETQALYHRFYLSLILHSLLRGGASQGVWSVADRFQCLRGFLQNIVNSSAAFASCLVHFTEELPELWSLHLLLPAVAKRLSFTASAELLPLMEIPGIKQGRARQLLAAGFHTPQDIANTDPSTICEKLEHMYQKQARKLVQAAKAHLADQAEALLEEAEELMALAPPTVD